MAEESVSRSRNLFERRALCRRVRLSDSGVSDVEWRPLIAALRQANAEHGDQDIEFQSLRFAVPFTDVVIKDPIADDYQLSKSLQIELDAEFANTDVEMAAVSALDLTVDDRFAYFGFGVFASMAHDVLIADLACSWVEPNDDGEIDEAQQLRPSVFASGTKTPAAWYAGQKALAVSFASNLAPVRIDLPENIGVNLGRALTECVLFIGRQSRYSEPVFELRLAEANTISTGGDEKADGLAAQIEEADKEDTPLRTRTVYAVGDMHAVQSGAWARIRLHVDGDEISLWLRLTGHTGAAIYSPPTINRATDSGLVGDNVVAIKGFILPEVRVNWLLFDNPSRWLVHFDKEYGCRHSEIAETFVTAVRETFGRTATARHTQGTRFEWEVGELVAPHRYRLLLGAGHYLEVNPFPKDIELCLRPDGKESLLQTKKYADAQRSQLSRLYRESKWTLICKAGKPDLAHIDFRAGRLVGEPVERLDMNQSSDERISLEWLNRTAQVQIGSRIHGAGEYWTRFFSGVITKGPKALSVSLQNKTKKAGEEYKIRLGDRGMLGPFYVEYRKHQVEP